MTRERIVEFSPRGGLELRMVLKGERGTVQFCVSTGWAAPGSGMPTISPLPTDLGYHSPVPRYVGQDMIDDSCPWLDWRPCYYDGSSLAALPVFDLLLTGGSDAVWTRLDEYYDEVFGPEPAP